MGATGFHYYRPFTSFTLSPLSRSYLVQRKERCTSHPCCTASGVQLQFAHHSPSMLSSTRTQLSAQTKEDTLRFCKTKQKVFPFNWQTLMCSSLWSRPSLQVSKMWISGISESHFCIEQDADTSATEVNPPLWLPEPVTEIRVLDVAK